MNIKVLSLLSFFTNTRTSLRRILIFLLIFQLIITLGTVGVLSFRYGQQAVLSLAEQLRKEITYRVEQSITAHLSIPQTLNYANLNVIKNGLLNTEDLKPWRNYVWRQIQHHDSVSFTIIGNENGDFLSVGAKGNSDFGVTGVNVPRINGEYDLYRYRTDKNGNLTDFISVNQHYDPRLRPWYQSAVKAGEASWSDIFQRTDDPSLLLSATQPIYDVEHHLQGVLATSFRLAALSEFLQSLEIVQGGVVYIIEKNHQLIASSIQENPYLLAKDNKTSLRRHTHESDNLLIKNSAAYLQQHIQLNGNLSALWNSDFAMKEGKHLLQVTPFKLGNNIDWLIVVAMPESAFMAPIHNSTRDTITLALFAICIAILFAWFMSRWISYPLQQLTQRAHWLAELNWEQSVTNTSLAAPILLGSQIEEVNNLANSFNLMAKQLQQSFYTIEQDLLALRHAQTELRKLSRAVEQSPIAIAILNLNGHVEYVNPAFEQQTGYSLHDIKAQLLPLLTLKVCEQQALWQTILRGETWQTELQNYHQTGTCYWEQVSISPIRNQNNLVTHYLVIQEDLTERKQTEQALQESEARFNLAMQGSNEGLWDWNLATNHVYFSPRWQEMLGYHAHDINPHIQEWHQRVHSDDLPDLLQQITRYWQQKSSTFTATHRIQHRDGHYLWVLVRGIAIWDAQGAPLRFVGTHMDLTSQKQAEAALRNSEARFKAVYDNAACGIMLFDSHGQVNQINNLGLELFGYSADIFNNISLFKSMPEQDAAQHQKKLQQLLTNKIDNYRLEQCFTHRQGFLFWVEIWVSKITLPDVNEPMFVAIMLDIAERKRMLQALNENRQRLQSIITNLPIILYSLNANGIFTLMQGRGLNLLGMNPTDIVGQSIFAVYRAQPLVVKAIQRGLTGEVVRYELELNDLVFESQQFPLTNEQYQVVGAIGVAIDITQRRQAEQVLQRAHAQAEQARQEAEQANRAKSTFLANMSHELRTPLNGILGYAQLLLQSVQINSHQKESVRIILRSGEHLLTLINDVLDISKIEAGKLELFPCDFCFPDFLKDILDLFRLRAVQKGLSFGYEQIPVAPTLDKDQGFPIMIHADEKRLRQILVNLLGNAIKFTEQGHVSLKIIYHNDRLRFEIEDTGCGIPDEQLEKIFLPFQQVSQQTRQTEGTGLGLSITRRLVETMGGSLHVNSLVNVGSIFWFEVQFLTLNYVSKVESNDDFTHIEGYRYLSLSTENTSAYRILIVDDIQQNRVLLGNLLTPLGFEVMEAVDGVKAFLAARKWRPDVILLDMKLPKYDGLTVVRRLRKHACFRETVIIALTADLFEYNRENTLAAGCDVFLTKPLNAQQLLNSLQQNLNLEWVYREKAVVTKLTSSVTEPVKLDLADLMQRLPISEHLAQLMPLCRAGRITQIIEYAKALQASEPALTPFTEVILDHARTFNINKIQSFLRSCETALHK